MKKDPLVFLRHILESIGRIEEFTKGATKEEFLKSIQLQDSVIRRIEIIGEATKNLPTEFQKEYDEVAWSKMARTRDKLIHGYFGVDLKMAWDIVKNDLPELKAKVQKILAEIEKEK